MKKMFLGSITTIILSGIFFCFYKKRNYFCKKEKNNENFVKIICNMNALLEAEDLFNSKNYAESFCKINLIEEECLTERARNWLCDLEKALSQKGKFKC